MPSNSTTILTQQTHIGDSSVQTHTGDKYRGDGYYGRSDGLHTVQVDLDGFIGKIQIEGSLAIDPQSDDWFVIELGTGTQTIDTTGVIREENITFVEYTESTTNSKSYNFTGNYVWVRVNVYDWTDGTVKSVMLNH
jgi:hypothetical protein